MSRKKANEINTADKILKIVYEALGGGQFNYHVAKLKDEIYETKLETLDTKRILEVVTALEKIVNMKNKAGETSDKETKPQGEIIIPETICPDEGGEEE